VKEIGELLISLKCFALGGGYESYGGYGVNGSVVVEVQR